MFRNYRPIDRLSGRRYSRGQSKEAFKFTIRRRRAGAIPDDDLLLEQQRFCGDGADATRSKEFRNGIEQVNREEKQVAHGWNGITPAMVRKTARKGPIPSY